MPFRNNAIAADGTIIAPALRSPDYQYIDAAHILGWELAKNSAVASFTAQTIRARGLQLANAVTQAWPDDPEVKRGVYSYDIVLNDLVYPYTPVEIFSNTTAINPIMNTFVNVTPQFFLDLGPSTYTLSSVHSIPKADWSVTIEAQVCLQNLVANPNWIALVCLVDGVQIGSAEFMTGTGVINTINMFKASWTVGNRSWNCDGLFPINANSHSVDIRIRSVTANQYKSIPASSPNRFKITQSREWNWT